MSRVSFTIKQPSAASVGSYLQYPIDPLLLEDDSSALRSDEYGALPEPVPVYNPAVSPYQSSALFSAEVVDYQDVRLSWTIGTSLSASPGAAPVATQIMIRYSTRSEPTSIQDGEWVTTILPGEEQYVYNHGGLPSGKWVYYSLFVKYEDNAGAVWYEKVVSTHVLLPTNFGSTDLLWNRIPEHYRLNDVLVHPDIPLSSPLFGRGQLYRMLSVFGWEMDRVRTLSKYQMVCKDPDLATPEVLDALAEELMIPFKTVDLGTERLRNVIGDIGYLREFKGTLNGTREWLTAITGCDVEITPTRPNLLNANERRFLGTLTTTTNPANVPTGDEWVFQGTGITAASIGGGGVTFGQTAASGYTVAVAKVLVSGLNQASWYRAYVDVTDRTDAQFLGMYLSASNTAASAVVVDENGDITSSPAGFVQAVTFGTTDWVQAPVDLGLVGTGASTTAPMYLHLFVRFDSASSSLVLDNVKLTTKDQAPYEINVYSQRVNLVRDPQFYYGTGASSSFWDITGPPDIATYTVAGGTLGASTGTGGSVTVTTFTGASPYTPVRLGTPYYFSCVDAQSNIQEVYLVSETYGTLASAGSPISTYATSDGGTRKSWQLLRRYEAPWLPDSISDCYLNVVAVVGAGESLEIRQPLLEPIRMAGEYFDGDNIEGTWFTGQTVNDLVSDYRWGDEGQHKAFSYFTSGYQNTKTTVNRILPTILPVTETSTPTVNYDRVYGHTGAGMP